MAHSDGVHMNRVFVIADTHFGHKKVIEFEPIARPFATIEEHDRALVERWNAMVKPKDTVWHLGDVFFGKDGHLPLASLHGLKRLVLGNHDHYPLAVYQQYFGKIYGAAEFGGCILTHVPVHSCQLEARYRRNLHGHMHSKRLSDDRYVCVSVENTGLAPMLMETALTFGLTQPGESK
jgi:calcineurin-like phosphoesterase family protein